MAQTDRLLSKVKIHKVELDRLESLGIPKRRVRAWGAPEGFTPESDQVLNRRKRGKLPA